MEKLEELWVYLPAELKLELGFYAARNKMYLTDVVLPLIANHIGRSDLVPVKRMLYNPVTAAGESAPGRRYTRKGKPRNPGGGMERLRLSMPSELRLEFKAYAARNKLSLTEIVLPLIANHIGRLDLAPVKGGLYNPGREGAELAPGRWYTRGGEPCNPPGGGGRLRVNIPSELRLEFKAYAARNKLSLTEIVLRLIANHIGRPDLAPVKGKLPSPEGEEATHAEEE